MKTTIAVRAALFVLLVSSAQATWANSVGFSQDTYSASSGQVTIELVYDFTTAAMFGGSVDITYDANFIEFVSFTSGPFPSDVAPSASPAGSLTEPGLYTGPGIGYLGPFGGITSAGTIGTFVFAIVGSPTQSTPCGSTLCITGNVNNPFISLTGADVTTALLESGFSSANVTAVPLPATLWFLLGSLGVLVSVGRKPLESNS